MEYVSLSSPRRRRLEATRNMRMRTRATSGQKSKIIRIVSVVARAERLRASVGVKSVRHSGMVKH